MALAIDEPFANLVGYLRRTLGRAIDVLLRSGRMLSFFGQRRPTCSASALVIFCRKIMEE